MTGYAKIDGITEKKYKPGAAVYLISTARFIERAAAGHDCFRFRYDPLYEAGWNNTDTRKPPLRHAGRSGSCGKGTASALGIGIRERYIT